MKSRVLYLFYAIFVVIIGLLSRRFSSYLPSGLNLVLGDALWAMMVYCLVAFVGNKCSVQRVAAVSLSICFVVEFSQLYQAEWIVAIRQNRFGALVLGRGFLWSDLLAYIIGIGIVGVLESCFNRRKN